MEKARTAPHGTIEPMRALAGWDLDWFRAIHLGMHRAWLDPVFWLLSSTGLGSVQGALMLFLLPFPKSRPLFGPLFANLVVFGLLSDAVKVWVPRVRPSNLPFAIPQESVFSTPSFPSGHSTTAFGIAVLLALTYRGTRLRWICWAFPVWAGLVALSRVYRGVHWPTDAIAGACLGMVGATLTYLLMERFGIAARLREVVA